MQTEKQRERLVELLKDAHFEWLRREYDHETDKNINKYVADYLMSNNVVVLPEDSFVEVKARIVCEDKEKAIVEEEYVITWKNKRTILKAKENDE